MVSPIAPASALRGPLSTESLLRVLGTLHGDRHTGVLHLSRGGEQLTLRFVDGRVVSGAQGLSGRLGEILLRCGRIQRLDLELALEKAALEGRRLGPVLVETHMVSREDVQEALRLQVRDVLFAAIFWGFGAYRFEPDAGPALHEEISLEISTPALIFEVVGAIERPGSVLRGLVDPATPLAAAPDAESALRHEKAPLGPTEAFVLSRLGSPATVDQIVASAPEGAEDVERSLLALRCCRAVLPRPERRIDPDETVALSREEVGLLPERLHALRLQDLEATLRSFEGKSHFEVLGVAKDAPAEEVKRAYLRRAREYHPDTARHPSLLEATKAVFLRVSEAYNVLSSDDSRRRHEQRLAQGPPAAAANAAPPPPKEEGGSDDGRPPVAEARDAQPLPGAAEAIERAGALLATGEAFEAVALLEDVLPHLTGRARSAARLLRARAYLKTRSGSRPAESELRDLLREAPDCVDAVLMLARLYRDHGMNRRAAKEYARMLELVPGHPEAARELRTLPSGDSGTARLKLAFGRR